MNLEIILKLKTPLILSLSILMIVMSWNDFTFGSIQELVVFVPLLIFYLNKTRYLELVDEGLSISYFTYELIIFLGLILLNIMLVYRFLFIWSQNI